MTVVVLTVAACGGGGDEDAASTTTSEAAVETTTTSTTMATTTTTEAVPFDIEVKRAAIALLEVRNEVFQNPDVSRVSEYISDSCICLDRERGLIERFVTEGLRWTAPGIQTRGINLSDPAPDNPLLTLVARNPEFEVVRTDGTVYELVPAAEAVAYSLSLVRNERGEWRVNSFEGIDLNEDSMNRLLAEGTP